jgi:peptidoglycan/LPS O-acetylase OafA/YrhL
MMVVFSFVLIFFALKYEVRIKPLEKIGAYSYTLYVSHYATIALVNVLAYRLGLHYYQIDAMWVWYLGIPASLLCAYLLYYVAERPSTQYLQKLRTKRKGKADTITPVPLAS